MRQLLRSVKKSHGGILYLAIQRRFTKWRTGRFSAHYIKSRLAEVIVAFGLVAQSYGQTPSITSISGTIADGDSITISGSDFGSHPLTYSWLGGRNGYIESGLKDSTTGNWPSGWGQLDNAWPDPVFNNVQAHSGSKSILQHDALGDSWWATEYYSYNFTTPQSKVYVSFWAKIEVLDGDWGQWKVLRISPDADVSDAESGEWDFLFNRVSENAFRRIQCEEYTGTTNPDGYPGDDKGLQYLWSYGGISIHADKWQRFEMEFAHNSSPGAEDGEIVIRAQIGTETPNESTMNTGWETRSENANDVLTNYIHFQSFCGNGINSENIWIDDPYVQWGTTARVELCTGSTWANRGRCEIQPPYEWDASDISVTLNTAGFSVDDTAYLYVVDENGNVNSDGYKVIIEQGSRPAIQVLTVNSGTGGGYYEEGSIVNIAPDDITGKSFDQWTDDTGHLNSPVTTAGNSVTIPAADVAVTATYTDILYTLTVENGTGSGTYKYKDVANIVAGTPPQGKKFDKWTGDVSGVEDIYDAITTITMPAEDVSVTATYREDTHLSISIISPGTDPYTSTSQTITVSGIASDDVGLRATNPVVISCPQCELIGDITGSTNWSVPLILAGGVGDDLFSGDGTFDNPDDWPIDYATGTGWVVSDGVLTNDGNWSNSSILKSFGAVIGTTYRFHYEVVAYTSGSLYLSQWGFPGEGHSILLDNTIGKHSIDVECGAAEDMRLVSNNWAGTLDNLIIGAVVTTNTVIATAYSTSGESISDTVSIDYTPEASNVHLLAVIAGTGSGNYETGTVINIAAGTPAQGYEFDKWTGDVDSIADIYSASTTITMPASDVSVTATYQFISNLTVNIAFPGVNPYTSTSQNITVTGTASDDTGLRTTNPIVVLCPQCESVGSVTGSTSWSVPVTLRSSGSTGEDLISGIGTFDSPGNWSVGTGWTISEGVATCAGSGSLQKPFGAVMGTTYRFYYEVTDYTSGSLYLSQWGFPGQGHSILLDNEIGAHTIDVVCGAAADLRITPSSWSGTLDNVEIREVVDSNVVTVIAYNTSGNSISDVVSIHYTSGTYVPTVTSSATGIIVYPNPANTMLTINRNQGWTGMAKVTIYAMEGRKIFETPQEVSFPYQVNISSYKPGIYLIKVSKGDKNFVKRIMKE